MVEASSSEGLVMALYVAYCLPHNVMLSAFNDSDPIIQVIVIDVCLLF